MAQHILDQGINELATLLATGVLRWHRSRPNVETTQLPATCLEVPSVVRLSVPSGERSREARPAHVQPAGGH